MALHVRAVQDRRATSRMGTCLTCQFTHRGIAYEAHIRDLSLGGAFLWSTFIPPNGADISIKITSTLLDCPLKLNATIVRTDCKYTDRGTAGAFSASFNHGSLELAGLVTKLAVPAFSDENVKRILQNPKSQKG
jgi:hypothetical protein